MEVNQRDNAIFRFQKGCSAPAWDWSAHVAAEVRRAQVTGVTDPDTALSKAQAPFPSALPRALIPTPQGLYRFVWEEQGV